MKIDYKNSLLVACEQSQIVTEAFRKKGIMAYSCDIEPGQINSNWHLKGDVKKYLNRPWKMIIAFPPCTYVSAAASNRLFINGKLNVERYIKGVYGREFFYQIYHNKCNYICIENPRNNIIFGYPTKNKYYINPGELGESYSKKTYLWLKNLPPIMPENYINLNYEKNHVVNVYGFERSKFHKRVAELMANQWSYIFKEEIC